MRWRATALALAAATLPLMCSDRDREHETLVGAFDATFVQIQVDQRAFDTERWKQELSILRELGIDLIILQYSGDERGPYDRAGHAPVAALLAAADELGMHVFLGLYEDPTWPSIEAVYRPAPPLDSAVEARALGQLCSRSRACAGWYLPQEIDDGTWATTEQTTALREHVARTARMLRELTPHKVIAIAPYFTGVLGPAENADWWLDVLEPGAIDILIMQDGVGTGRATPELAGMYLAEMRPVADTLGIELWSVAELFQQTHGSPVDDQPFAAVPIQPATLRHSLATEYPLVDRIVAFAVLDYMDPRRGGAARRLYDDYAARCRVARSSRRTPC